MTTPAPTITTELKTLLRAVKLGRCLDTLPERLALAKARDLSHARVPGAGPRRRGHPPRDLLRQPAGPRRRARPGHGLGELGPHHQGQLRPPGLGRAVLAALRRRRPQRLDPGPRRGRQDLHGHRPRPRRGPPPLQRRLLPHRRAVQKAPSVPPRQQPRRRDPQTAPRRPAHPRRLRPPALRRPRHRRHLRAHRRTPPRRPPRVVTSNREPIEWLAQMADPLLAQSAIDRLQSAAYELVLDGESYRRRQKPGLDIGTTTARPRRRRRT